MTMTECELREQVESLLFRVLVYEAKVERLEAAVKQMQDERTLAFPVAAIEERPTCREDLV